MTFISIDRPACFAKPLSTDTISGAEEIDVLKGKAFYG